MVKRNKPSWVALYNKLSHKLLEFKDDRAGLVAILKKIDQSGISVPFLSEKLKDNTLKDIDPFTLYLCLCKHPGSKNIEAFRHAFYKAMGIESVREIQYDLFPHFVENKPINKFLPPYLYENQHVPNGVDAYWDLFSSVVAYADEASASNEIKLKETLLMCYEVNNIVIHNLSPVLYMIDPTTYPFMFDIKSQDKSVEYSMAHDKQSDFNFNYYHYHQDHDRNTRKDREFLANRFIKCIKAYKAYFAREDIEINDFTELYAVANKMELKSYPEPQPNAKLETYTPEDFKKEIFIGDGEYEKIVSLLHYKKNLCLQGPPGVGKTFMAKRLAYSIMGVKDDAKIKFVQFHQSYSYEDFIMGYRPTENGFEIHNGAFYTFCKEAAKDDSHDYFFIIDEINRGNLSKIFGELFMLVENDKRGMSLRLLYKDEEFSIPENLYIIGMMNTADRSLAMMDYALRRRFAFYTVKPHLGDQLLKIIGDNTQLVNLVHEVEELNAAISEDDLLGPEFQIGHSYFCVSEEHLSDENIASNIVEYELIPLLEEYWYDNDRNDQRDKWVKKLRESIK